MIQVHAGVELKADRVQDKDQIPEAADVRKDTGGEGERRQRPQTHIRDKSDKGKLG